MADTHSAPLSPSQPMVLRESTDTLSQSLSDQIETLASELRARWKPLASSNNSPALRNSPTNAASCIVI